MTSLWFAKIKEQTNCEMSYHYHFGILQAMNGDILNGSTFHDQAIMKATTTLAASGTQWMMTPSSISSLITLMVPCITQREDMAGWLPHRCVLNQDHYIYIKYNLPKCTQSSSHIEMFQQAHCAFCKLIFHTPLFGLKWIGVYHSSTCFIVIQATEGVNTHVA